MAARLSHTDARGRVRMVDVGDKAETEREAVASAAVRMSAATLGLAMGVQGSLSGSAPKGDVVATARLAAIAALKRTAEWIPLCHPVRLVGCAVDIDADDQLPGIRVRVTARAFDRTGVEMEAMVGAAAAALTIYDMVKGAERGVEILNVRLEEKRGGRTGQWRRSPNATGTSATPQAVHRQGRGSTRGPKPHSRPDR